MKFIFNTIDFSKAIPLSIDTWPELPILKIEIEAETKEEAEKKFEEIIRETNNL